ncbi:hypothetical protein PV367_01105 [Streptomyces europaeiscabiei]|uniref:Uncharacterized protein n=1 Tax=Streptomyces europaeiscabiei TaxID=146819 RepID=A0AAJ2UJ18_9ACTN|nr:hypothetical protein [Streptomyces europaeiscabiei]MDX3128429.1 hypothetical protein [Streptomyces europaeiscabiei]
MPAGKVQNRAARFGVAVDEPAHREPIQHRVQIAGEDRTRDGPPDTGLLGDVRHEILVDVQVVPVLTARQLLHTCLPQGVVGQFIPGQLFAGTGLRTVPEGMEALLDGRTQLRLPGTRLPGGHHETVRDPRNHLLEKVFT